MFGFIYITINDNHLFEFSVGEEGEVDMHRIDLIEYPYRKSYIEDQGERIYHA